MVSMVTLLLTGRRYHQNQVDLKKQPAAEDGDINSLLTKSGISPAAATGDAWDAGKG